jgi:hypothetical protein
MSLLPVPVFVEPRGGIFTVDTADCGGCLRKVRIGIFRNEAGTALLRETGDLTLTKS